MNRFLFTVSAFALALSTGPVVAADLPYRKAPPPTYYAPAPIANWTGFYAGLNAGGTFGGSDNVNVATGVFGPGVDAAALGAVGSGVGNANFGGFIGGGQIGYNYQFSPAVVAGFEADIQGLAGGGGTSSFSVASPGALNPTHTFGGTVSASQSLDYLGTVRGRIGYLFTPSLLVYATGGLAYGGANLNSSFSATEMNAAGAFVGSAFGGVSQSNTQVGWTVGGGLEWMFAHNWSAKVEYLYYDLGTLSVSGPVQYANSVTGATGFGASQTSAQFNGHIVRAGVNYHFNWAAPAPILAKY
ncbi:MAG: outer membrane beta-barrel protein [Methylocystis sp.]